MTICFSPRSWFILLSLNCLRSVDAITGRGDQSLTAPNIIFLVVESTDGRTWQRGYQEDVIPLPNLRRLEDSGAISFYRHYCNSPVCCPSRASFWSGKHPHKIPHDQASPSPGGHSASYPVNGVWNNFEGLPTNYSNAIFDVLERHDYTTLLSGKHDYFAGGHSLTTRLNAWTMYTQFPYNLTDQKPWVEEIASCRINGTILPTNASNPIETGSHKGDWRDLNQTLDWIREYHQANTTTTTTTTGKPFFVYQGMSIVHPPYITSQYWLDKIDEAKITVPKWPTSLEDLHPCDVQTSMLKGCLPTNAKEMDSVRSVTRRRQLRRIYYAMIAEFDTMVGRYLDTLDELGLANNTVVIVTSDHGDMQMEHTQFYKMSPYDASSSVPLIVYDPRRSTSTNRIVRQPTQHIDLFPTILELAGISSLPSTTATATCPPHCHSDIPQDLDGFSLVPFLDEITTNGLSTSERNQQATIRSRGLDEKMKTSANPNKADDDLTPRQGKHAWQYSPRPPFVVTQYHGDDSPMSWFLVVQYFPCMQNAVEVWSQQQETNDGREEDGNGCLYKLIIWGTGQEVDSQLFDLTNDPDEATNLIHAPDYQVIVGAIDTNLQTIVDYAAVAQDVAKYNVDSFERWRSQNAQNWTSILSDEASRLRWHASWEQQGTGRALEAIDEWLALPQPTPVRGCRREMAWPPRLATTTTIRNGITNPSSIRTREPKVVAS